MQPQRQTEAPEPYQPDSIDYNRVFERASQAYYREYWSSYKGRVRGMLSGVMVGTAIGLAIGVAAAGLLVATGGIAGGMLGTAGLATIAGFTGLIAIRGAEVYGSAGSAAASRSAGLAERHARVLDPVYKNNEVASLDDKLMMDGRGHHFQFPADRDKGKWFNWKSGTVGAAFGAGLGGLLALGATVATGPLGVLATAGVPLAAAGGALGLTFGIDRSNLKDIFNKVDAASWGKTKSDFAGIDKGRAQFGAIENDKQLAEHRMQRQASTFALEEEYHNKIYARSVKGLFRGLAGGAVAGAVIGAAVGLLAFGALTLVPALATTAIAGKGLLIAAAFGAIGATYGMRVFSDAGREAGAESMARAIDNEFERNQELRRQGITPQKPLPEPERYINVKAALAMAAVGAVVGAIAIPGLIAVEGLEFAGIAASAAMTPAVVGIAAAIGGVMGMTYGIGGDSLKSLSKFTDWLYDKSYVVHNDPTSKPYVVPLPAPNAPKPEQVTQEDMNRMHERMSERPQQNFEAALLASKVKNTANVMEV